MRCVVPIYPEAASVRSPFRSPPSPSSQHSTLSLQIEKTQKKIRNCFRFVFRSKVGVDATDENGIRFNKVYKNADKIRELLFVRQFQLIFRIRI